MVEMNESVLEQTDFCYLEAGRIISFVERPICTKYLNSCLSQEVCIKGLQREVNLVRRTASAVEGKDGKVGFPGTPGIVVLKC